MQLVEGSTSGARQPSPQNSPHVQMSNAKLFSLITLPSLLLLAAFAPAAKPPSHMDSAIVAIADSANVVPDNSAINQRDRLAEEPTADEAKNHMNDRDTMQKIRKSVVADQSLSTYAHNIKIISQNGKVTLKGPVQSDQEKQNVDAKATGIAGQGNVNDELSVMPAK